MVCDLSKNIAYCYFANAAIFFPKRRAIGRGHFLGVHPLRITTTSSSKLRVGFTVAEEDNA